MAYNPHQHYGQQQGNTHVYDESNEHADIDEPAVAEARPIVFPASHPLFTREEISNTRALDPYPPTQSPQSWPPYESSFQQQPISYAPYPSSSLFHPPRLSTPPTAHHQTFHFKAPGQSTSPGSATHRLTLAGSLDPATGIFYRTPEHPRLRTAQACEKCRTRKAKCSGEHPSCKRCITRGLICEYAKEGRVRGPNKPKLKNNATSMASPSASASSTSTVASVAEKNEAMPTMTNPSERASQAARHRAPSSHSSGSSDQTTNEAAGQSLFLPPSIGIRNPQIPRGEYIQPLSDSPPPSATPISLSRGRRSVMGSGASTPSCSRQNSLSEQHPSRPNPLDVHRDTASSLFRLSGVQVGEAGLSRSGSVSTIGSRMGDHGSMGNPVRDDSGFYHFQSHPQVEHPHRGYLAAETGIPEQHHIQRHSQQAEQSYQPFHSQRNVFPLPSQYGGGQNPRRETHSLNQVSMRTGTPQGLSPFSSHGSIHPHGENFRRQQQQQQQQQQQHSLVPIMPSGVGLPDETSDEFTYPPQPVGSYYHPSDHNSRHLPELAIDTAVRGHPHQHEYRQHVEHQQHHPQHHVVHSQITEQIYQDHRQPHYPNRPSYEVAYHSHPQTHVVMGGASPRAASATSSRAHDSSSPFTASSSGGIPIYHHHYHGDGAITSGSIRLDPRLDSEMGTFTSGMPPSSSSSPVSSIAAFQPNDRHRHPEGGDLYPSHSGDVSMDVEQVQHIDVAGNAAVHHRGNGHGLRISASLASLGSNVSRLGPSPSSVYTGIVGERKADAEGEDADHSGCSAPLDMMR